MEKLLHERLREIQDGYKEEWGGECQVQGHALVVTKEEAQVLADEIEHYYIPRPRFEDGKPVQWGESVKHPYGAVDVDKAEAFRIHKSGYMSIEGVNDYYVHSSNGIFKRPAKALCADGVEIKVGDVLYRTDGNEKITVAKIESMCIVDCEGIGLNPAYYTHREPDSLEKLRDDMLNAEPPFGSITAGKWAYRLTAIMERDA